MEESPQQQCHDAQWGRIGWASSSWVSGCLWLLGLLPIASTLPLWQLTLFLWRPRSPPFSRPLYSAEQSISKLEPRTAARYSDEHLMLMLEAKGAAHQSLERSIIQAQARQAADQSRSNGGSSGYALQYTAVERSSPSACMPGHAT